MIKIKNYDKEKQKINFVTDMSVSLANAIRRSVLEIPIMAIDEVEISKNDSALFDEILAHRIGLIPIKTDKIIKETKFKLKEKGPKMVYSTDLQPSGGTDFKLPILILNKDQEVELVANARLGTGIEHIKYSPGLIFYRHDIDPEVLDYIHINEDGIVSYSENELKEKRVSEELIKKIKALTKVPQIDIYIESWGQIEVKKIFSEAIDILNKDLTELNNVVK